VKGGIVRTCEKRSISSIKIIPDTCYFTMALCMEVSVPNVLPSPAESSVLLSRTTPPELQFDFLACAPYLLDFSLEDIIVDCLDR
jgi:hypothetical protein